ncbi:MAG: bifunctional methylenetetrahydrofolate dehydrogenase/methenyltetrahydrofolate cyclohydrolase FolD [Sinobacteraceae bacterium]|nr:bifunctional methylenetetrahydrofolate dehydrogenase/methenyltetrahydrofolate cyclohydrolase FolD [Nevskiaceae bacterium]
MAFPVESALELQFRSPYRFCPAIFPAMQTRLIDGKAVAAHVISRVTEGVEKRRQNGCRAPVLVTILVGDNAASAIYVRKKHEACALIGIESRPINLPAETRQEELLSHIQACNDDDDIDGILVQLPLPKQIDSTIVIESIRPDKDVDGFHPYNVGRLAQRIPALRPCTPAGVIELLHHTGEPFHGRTACVVGASNHVGRPMALELLLAGATVTVCHRFTRDLARHVSEADIVIAAVGRPGLVKGEWIKQGATVIDVGINRMDDGHLCGDVAYDHSTGQAAWITPVPGGVGPMTVAMLMHNTLQACEGRTGPPIFPHQAASTQASENQG